MTTQFSTEVISYDHLVRLVLRELEGALASVNAEELATLRQALLDAHRIFIAGMGRTGLQMRGFAIRLMHLGLPVHVVGETTTPGIAERDFLVIGSGSGRTPSLVQHAQIARAYKAQVALITTLVESPISDIADYILRINAPTLKPNDSADSRSIQPMGSLFEQSLGLVLDILVLQLMSELEITAKQMFARHATLE